MYQYPTIDPAATGRNITRLRKEHGLTVQQLQSYCGFTAPQSIYHWQQGKALPSVDNLFALSALFGVPMNEILVAAPQKLHIAAEQQAEDACCSAVSGVFDALRPVFYPAAA